MKTKENMKTICLAMMTMTAACATAQLPSESKEDQEICVEGDWLCQPHTPQQHSDAQVQSDYPGAVILQHMGCTSTSNGDVRCVSLVRFDSNGNPSSTGEVECLHYSGCADSPQGPSCWDYVDCIIGPD